MRLPFEPTPSAPAVNGGRFLVVAFHDLAPHTQLPCQELLLQLAELGVPRASLLVSPGGRGTDLPFFTRWLRTAADAGHEVCREGDPETPWRTAPSVSFSVDSLWHRLASPLMGRLRFAAARQAPVLRIAVHPDDLYEQGVRRTLVALLRKALRDRIPVTYAELAERAAERN